MTWDIWPDASVARELRDREMPTVLVGTTDPVCPSCAQRFSKMPQRKGSCASCGLIYVSRTCPIRRQKILVKPEELDGMEPLWGYLRLANELSRHLSVSGNLMPGAAGASLIDTAVNNLSSSVRPHSFREWSASGVGWTQLAGACALALRVELAVHALTGRIALDISGAESDFGAFIDDKHFERELAKLEGTEPPPFPHDISLFRREGACWYVPVVPLPNIGAVNPWSLQMLESLCRFGGVTIDFVRWSIEVHCEAMTTRGAPMVRREEAWARFTSLASQVETPSRMPSVS